MLPRLALTLLLAAVAGLAIPAPALAQREKVKPAERDRTQQQKDEEAAAAGGAGLLCIAFFVILGAAFYFAPTIVGVMRQHPNLAPILIVNIFLGWSLIGWVVALAWAFTAQEPSYRGGYRRRSPSRGANPFDDE